MICSHMSGSCFTLVGPDSHQHMYDCIINLICISKNNAWTVSNLIEIKPVQILVAPQYQASQPE